MVQHVEVQVLVLLLIASLVGMLARRARLPYTLALVLAGLAIGFFRVDALRGVSLTPELLLLLFLPPLLFEAAYHLPFSDLRQNAKHIAALAIGGVIVGVGIAAGLSHWAIAGLGLWGGFDWAHAFLFASILAATDPISVLALFRELGAPKRLYQVVEAESLINDGVAVVIFAIVAAVVGIPTHGEPVVFSGAQDIATYAVATFLRTGVGGVLAGAAMGALASVLTRQVDDHLIEITITTLVAWGSFLVAEQLHLSGVLSTVAAGVTIGSFGKHYGMSASTRIAVQDFWQYMGFLSNSFIFLLVGLQLEPGQLIQHLGLILVGFTALVATRAVVIYAGMPWVDRWAVPLPSRWRHVLVWSGLRGSLSMVLVLGLPGDLPGRSLLVHLVFGVVALSLFLQGLTLSPLMKRLGISGGKDPAAGRAYQLERARAIAFRRVVNQADALLEQHLLDNNTHARLRGFYAEALERARGAARELAGRTARPEQLLEGAKALGAIERDAIADSLRAGVISQSVAADLLRVLDTRLDAVDHAAQQGEAELMAKLDEFYPASRTDRE